MHTLWFYQITLLTNELLTYNMNAYSIYNTSKHIVSKPNKYIAPTLQIEHSIWHFSVRHSNDTNTCYIRLLLLFKLLLVSCRPDSVVSCKWCPTRHKHMLKSITSTFQIITHVDLSMLYLVSNTIQTCVTFNYLLFNQIITRVN